MFAAYALARLEFPGKFVVLGFILGASMFPGVALVTPLFKLFTNIEWLAGQLPGADHPVHLLRAAADDLHADRVLGRDAVGAGGGGPDRRVHPGQAFRKVILPLAAPGLFTTAILVFMASLERVPARLAVLRRPQTQTVTVAIAYFTGSQPHQEPYTAVMAAGAIVTVPLIIMVLVFQRRIVSGLTAGGVKG